MLTRKLNNLFSDRFIRNVSWLGVAELVNRIFRLLTTITLARAFSPSDYGAVSIIYTVFEFASVFSLRTGVGAKIIHANDQELDDVCNTAYWLNWLLGIILFLTQCIVAYPISQFFRNDQLTLPICLLALIYLIFPFFLVQSSLIERENRLKITALCSAAQAILSNIIIVVLALLGMGVWAVVWSMVVTYPVWIFISHSNHSWRPPKFFTLHGWQGIVSYGSKLMGVELLSKLRMYLDYLLIGRFIGIEALGVYFFAFNAGLGISQSIIYSISVALFPHLCAERDNQSQLKKQFFNSLKTSLLIITPLVLLQTTLAPFYVPVVFGQRWVEAIPILVLICFSALPITISRVTSQLLQAVNKTKIDFYWNIIFTILFATALLLAVQNGIVAVAVVVLVTQAIAMPIFTAWVIHHLFFRKLAA